MSKKDKIKICFLLEEALLRFQEKFGEDYQFNFVTKKWFGTPKVLIKVRGTAYNPLEDDDEEQIFSASVMRNLLNYETAGTVYRYENGCNEISAFSTKETKKLKIPGGSITVAILLALILGDCLQLPARPHEIYFDIGICIADFEHAIRTDYRNKFTDDIYIDCGEYLRD